MFLITAPTQCRVDAPPSPLIESGEKIVVPEDAGTKLVNEVWRQARRETQWSSMGCFERPYQGNDLNSKRLLVYRGAGYGDLIIVAGICRELKKKWPRAEIDLWHSGRRYGMWRGARSLPLRSCILPIPFSEWQKYDYHLLYEGMVEACTEPTQPDIWTAHLQKAGITWDCDRVPYVPIRDKARTRIRKLVKRWTGGKPWILYQLCATSPVRSFAPWKTREVLQALRDSFPGTPIICPKVDDKQQVEAVAGLGQIVHMPDIQHLFALTEQATCLVCPDSCLGHASATLNVPTVSLWAAFHPRDRIVTYTNHTAIYKESDCGPCRRHEGQNRALGSFDPSKVYRGCTLNQSYCHAMSQISTETIVNAVKGALNDHS